MSNVIYLDNAATTFPKPEAVYASADAFYRAAGANAGRGQNPLARRAAHLVAEVRADVAAWLGAAGPERVIFSPSATIALNQAIFGTPLRPGDAVYVTPFEHNSVLRPVEHLRQTRGVDVCVLPADPLNLEIPLDRVEVQFRTRPPALLAVAQVSNVCGLQLPVAELAGLARAANPEVIIIVDGAQGAGLYPLPLRDGIIDYLVFSGHKSLYGPYGAAGLVLASHRRPRPVLFGGTGTESESITMPEEPPAAYEPGSLNVWALAGLGAAIDWLRATGRRSLEERVQELAAVLIEGLSRLPGVQLHLPPPDRRTSIVSFTCPGTSPAAIEALLGAANIAVRAGLHCAPWCHRLLGTLGNGGSVRVSPGYFNSVADVEALLTALRRAVAT